MEGRAVPDGLFSDCSCLIRSLFDTRHVLPPACDGFTLSIFKQLPRPCQPPYLCALCCDGNREITYLQTTFAAAVSPFHSDCSHLCSFLQTKETENRALFRLEVRILFYCLKMEEVMPPLQAEPCLISVKHLHRRR